MADDITQGTMEEYPTMQCGSRLTVEQERDSYKEKLLHMKLVMKEMQQSLQSQKIRKEGVETVSILLKESRQQIATLENQKRALETAVRNLQNRLANHGLSNSVTFEENELFIPGTSKQILDNLAKENQRLRNLIGTSGSFEELSKLQETIQKLQSFNSTLQIERDNLLQKVTDLENMLKSSDSEKDKVIGQLRNHIEKLQSNSRTQDVLCQSMSGEVSDLRHRLRDFVLQCQQLEIRLEKEEGGKTELESPNDTPDGKLLEGNSQSQKNKVSHKDTPDDNILVEENTRLKDEIKVLKEMNQRWQDYNNDRERYLRELNSNYRELQQKYKLGEETRVTEERERQLNNLIMSAKDKLEKMGNDKKQMEEKLALSETTILNQAAEIQHLKSNMGMADEETIGALKAQIQVCTEDFETERRDRAAAQARAHQLADEVHQLRMENQQLRHQFQNLSNSGQTLLSRHQQPYVRHQSMAQEIPQLTARGFNRQVVTADGMNDSETDGNLPLNNLSNPRGSLPMGQGLSNFSSGPVSLPVMRSQPPLLRVVRNKKEEDTLCCPKCSQGFSEEEQDKLLEHMELCCE